MIIVRVFGGLGNQMFQYAYAKALQEKGFSVSLDISKFKNYNSHGGYQLNKYNTTIKKANSTPIFLGKLGIKKNLKEKSLNFDKKLLDLKGYEYVRGYFQTEEYFKTIRNILLKEFITKNDLSSSTIAYANKIKSAPISCSLHIRRGDYITDKKANSIHGICSLEYYHQAITILKEKFTEINFFIFSDDINWSKENLLIENATYVDHKTIPHEDIYLMSLCDHNITANSSFSWWGAWLNENTKKTVIAPKQWFVKKQNEIACKSWIKI